MVQLMIMMLERVGIIVILGFMLAHMKVFRQHLQHPEGYKGKGVLIFIFPCSASSATIQALKSGSARF